MLIKIIKTLSLIILISFLIVNNESNKIINKEKFFNGERFTNHCIRPLLIKSIPENMPIITLLYWGYYNKIFNLTYLKLKYDKKIWKKEVVKGVIKNIFFMYLGISRFLIKIIMSIFKTKEKTIEDFLLEKFYNPKDDRIIIMVDGVWYTNNLLKIIKQDLMATLINSKKNLIFNENEVNNILNEMSIMSKNLKIVDDDSKTFKAIFTNIKNRTAHKVHEDFLIDKDFKAYETSYDAAYNKNFYKLKPIVYNFMGSYKNTSLLSINKKELSQISGFKKESIMQIYRGAIKSGYSEELIADKHLNNIEKMLELKKKLDKILNNYGLTDEDDLDRMFDYVIDLTDYIELDLI